MYKFSFSHRYGCNWSQGIKLKFVISFWSGKIALRNLQEKKLQEKKPPLKSEGRKESINSEYIRAPKRIVCLSYADYDG